MRSHVDMAKEIVGELSVVINAMSGLVHAVFGSSRLPNKAQMTALRADLYDAATVKSEKALSMLDSAAYELASRETQRATAEAGLDVSKVAVFDNPVVSTARERIVFELCAYATEGARIANGYAQRFAVNHSAGWPLDKALRLAESGYRDRLGRWSAGKIGVRSNLTHSLFLLIADTLQQVRVEAYVLKSVELGANRFRLSQPGYDRDGIEFHASTLPVDELHPQSEAVIYALR